MTSFYTEKEWATISIETKMAFGAGNVQRIRKSNGKYEWAVYEG